MAEEVVKLSDLAVLGNDEVGSLIHLVPTNYNNAPSPKNVPASTNQGGAVYNEDWGCVFILRRHLTGANNHNL